MSVIQTVTVDRGWITTLNVLWVGHGQSASVVLSSLARIIRTTTVNVIGIFGVESVFETLGLIQIELFLRNVHRVPLFAENLADLTGAHHLVCSRHFWSALSGKDHKGIHRAFRSPVRVERLSDQRISEDGTILIVAGVR